MFEKVSKAAEQVAASASRREFLGRLGRGAVIAAGTVAGYLAFGSEAQAGRRCCTSDADCRQGRLCEAGRCVKGVRPPQVCGPDSLAGQCRNRPVGSVCGSPSRPGRCVGPPNCTCQAVRGRSGPRRG